MIKKDRVYISFKNGTKHLDLFMIHDLEVKEIGLQKYYDGKSVFIDLKKDKNVSELKWDEDKILVEHVNEALPLKEFIKDFSKLIPEVHKLIIFNKLDNI